MTVPLYFLSSNISGPLGRSVHGCTQSLIEKLGITQGNGVDVTRRRAQLIDLEFIEFVLVRKKSTDAFGPIGIQTGKRNDAVPKGSQATLFLKGTPI